MQKIPRIYLDRLDKFISSSSYTSVNLYGKLVEYQSTDGIELFVHSVKNEDTSNDDSDGNENKNPSFNAIVNRDFRSAKAGEEFGPTWSTHWFKVIVKIPKALDGKAVYLHWKIDTEALVYDELGHPLQGLNNQDRNDFLIDAHAVSDKTFTFLIEMACNGLFGAGVNGIIDPPDENRKYRLDCVELRVYNQAAKNLYMSFQIIAELARIAENPRSSQALFVANNIINAFDNPKCGNDPFKESQDIANEFLSHQNNVNCPHVSAVGHCHIDSAWLWTFQETRRKCARSWASQIRFMKTHPEFKFVCPQMQQLDWLSHDHPFLFNEIQEAAKRGQFIPVGGSWVEMDGNLPSGESFLRQFLYGQKFMAENFGFTSKIFWLPDTFGYNPQLPQLMQHAGMCFFLSQKLSWNNINKFPHSSFWWRGLDGTKVLSHFPPADTYCSMVSVSDLYQSDKNNKDRDRTQKSLLLFGHGDGGGGPTEYMIQKAKKMANINGLAKLEIMNPLDFFQNLQKDGDKFLTWSGELYFELHRGTFTSQSRTKYYNRTCEGLLREVEIVSTMLQFLKTVSDKSIGSSSSSSSSLSYPRESLEKLWKIVLLNQFHDVLPGSSIEQVYKQVHELYTKVEVECRNIRESSFKKMFLNYSNENEGQVIFINLSPFKRTEVVSVPFSFQDLQPGFVCVKNIPPYSICYLKDIITREEMDQKQVANAIKEGNDLFILENCLVKAVFNSIGRLVSYRDKENDREILSEEANVFLMFEDVPIFWDAWDVEIYHEEKYWPVDLESTVEIKEKGPLKATLMRKVKISQTSSMIQLISLTCTSFLLEFHCSIEWNESHKMLKVIFPLALSCEYASFETAFGIVKRPTHRNTNWDVAKFEVCGHRWIDLSEPDYGVAILNDCKYGFSIRENVIRLSLLRAPKSPDPHCDIGQHIIRYGLLPHEGSCDQNNSVTSAAYHFNNSLRWSSESKCSNDILGKSLFSISPDTSSLIIDTIKLAEDCNNDIILRAYESLGKRGKAKLMVHSIFGLQEMYFCNALEKRLSSEIKDLIIEYEPFKIYTIRLRCNNSNNGSNNFEIL